MQRSDFDFFFISLEAILVFKTRKGASS